MTRRALTRVALGPALALALGACAPGDYFDKWFGPGPAMKPAELINFKPSATAKILWRGSVGGSDRYVFTPFVDGGTVYAAGASGQIERFDAASGKVLGRIDAKNALAGGIGGNRNLLLAGTAKGEVLALDAGGKVLWKTQLTSDVLSAPQAEQGVVVVRTGDGRIYGLDAANGSRKWVYQRTLPPLTVRTFIGIVLERGGVFAGFPGGRLVAISLGNGNVGWEATVALPKGATELERMADISSLPVIDGAQICAVAYQGRVGCFDLLKGSPNWTRDSSSISGLTVDDRNVYVTDDKSAVVAFEKRAGASLWKQDKLYGRYASAPVAIGRFVAVGDYQGYVHFLSREDGSFVARIATDGSPIIAPPLSLGHGILVQTRNGGVYAIGIQ